MKIVYESNPEYPCEDLYQINKMYNEENNDWEFYGSEENWICYNSKDGLTMNWNEKEEEYDSEMFECPCCES